MKIFALYDVTDGTITQTVQARDASICESDDVNIACIEVDDVVDQSQWKVDITATPPVLIPIP